LNTRHGAPFAGFREVIEIAGQQHRAGSFQAHEERRVTRRMPRRADDRDRAVAEYVVVRGERNGARVFEWLYGAKNSAFARASSANM
jgi:hypothetical protein